MKKIVLICIFFFVLIGLTAQRVVKIKDGDTVVVLDNYNEITLRLAEIDTPELGEPYSYRAKQFTSDAIYNKIIKYDSIDVDRYGRTIAKIYYDDNKYLSAELIKNGLAIVYLKYSQNKYLLNLQDIAKRQKIGIWQ